LENFDGVEFVYVVLRGHGVIEIIHSFNVTKELLELEVSETQIDLEDLSWATTEQEMLDVREQPLQERFHVSSFMKLSVPNKGLTEANGKIVFDILTSYFIEEYDFRNLSVSSLHTVQKLLTAKTVSTKEAQMLIDEIAQMRLDPKWMNVRLKIAELIKRGLYFNDRNEAVIAYQKLLAYNRSIQIVETTSQSRQTESSDTIETDQEIHPNPDPDGDGYCNIVHTRDELHYHRLPISYSTRGGAIRWTCHHGLKYSPRQYNRHD
jgi:hypothetical protein